MGGWNSKPSRPRMDWSKGCVGKARYSAGEADRMAKRIAKERNVPTMRAYPCSFCGKWHLTSSPKKER